MNRHVQIPKILMKRIDAVGLERGSVVDQHVQRPEGRGRRRNQPHALAAGRKIGPQDLGPPPIRADRVGQCLGLGAGRTVMDDHAIALGGQPRGDGRADPVCCSGYEGNALHQSLRFLETRPR